MGKFENGLIADKNIEVKTFPSIEHDALKKVTSIVLHRTDSSTASSSLNAYKAGQKTGAHFLIDKSGKIYQTASLLKTCWHVGILQPRCLNENSCAPEDLKTINAMLHERGMSFGRRATNVSDSENRKVYPLRYPSNSDSIGIEVVGLFLTGNQVYETPTSAQLYQTKWLTQLLLTEYGLKLNADVYSHGAIARKQPAEGAQLLKYLFSGA